MLSLEADKLCDEVARAEEFRRKHTFKLRQIVQRFASNWFRSDMVDADGATPENLVFSYIAWMLPNLAYSNPTLRVQGSRPASDREVADWMDWGLREWLHQAKYARVNRDTVRDMLIGWGVQVTGVRGRDFPGEAKSNDPGRLVPFACRVAPEHLILDPSCQTVDEARYIGHKYWRDLDELENDPIQWPPDKVAQLSGGAEGDTVTVNERPTRPGETPERRRVCLVDLWIPEHGLLVTIALQGDAASGGGIILRLESYWGPPTGPYQVYGAYSVPGDPYPLGVLPVVMEQLEELWAHQRQASDEAINYKRVILVEATAIDAQKAIMEGTSGGVYPVNGLGNKVQELDVGGAPPGRIEHQNMVRDRADRTLGLGDAQRGLAGGKTATENTIVQSNVDVRTAYLRSMVQEHTAAVMMKVGWFLFYDAGVTLPVSHTDPMTGHITEGDFLGGVQRGQEGIDWMDFHLTIDVQSMQHTDDQALQQRAMELLNVGAQVCPLMLQFPFWNWRWVLNNIGESFNQKGLADILVNQQALQQFGQMQALFGGAAGQLPAGVGPDAVNAGLGQPGGPGPTWQSASAPAAGLLPPGAMGGMVSGGGGGPGFRGGVGTGMSDPRGGGGGGAGFRGGVGTGMSDPRSSGGGGNGRSGGVASAGGGGLSQGGKRNVQPGPRTTPFMFIGNKASGGPRAGAKAALAAAGSSRPGVGKVAAGPRTPKPAPKKP